MVGHGKNAHKITFFVLIVGGLNWLFLGLFGTELGSLFGGPAALLSRGLYILMGLAAVYELMNHKENCAKCKEGRAGSAKSAQNMSSTPTQPPTPSV